VSDRLVGIDVGGTKTLAVAIKRDQPAVVLEQHIVRTPSTAEGVLGQLIDLAVAMGAVDSLGVGLAGLVENGDVLRAAPNLTCMIDVSAQAALQEKLGISIRIENDATCALIAEMEIGVGRDASDVVLVTLGTGIGGAIAIDGKIRRGAHGFAGEPGHMCVNPNGPVCVCGRRGCWERYASGTGLVWLARQQGLASVEGRDAVTSEELVSRARAGDADALAVWDEFAEWLALGLANLADVLDPALLVLGGGLTEVADLYLDRTRERFVDEVLGGRSRSGTRIEVAQSGPTAGAIGAALLH
jgi:glucokinase